MVSIHNIRMQHSSMQYSDNPAEHQHDAKAVFDRAKLRRVWACTGTEAKGDSDLHEDLAHQARAHGYHFYGSRPGEWVGLAEDVFYDIKQGFAGPFIPASGKPAALGGHTARGIAWVSGLVKGDAGQGRITFGAAHFLTNRSENVSGSNEPLLRGLGEWGKDHGQGKDVVFVGADVNENDRGHDVFHGQPFTSIADELGKWPATRAGAAIDVIASYTPDRRVKAEYYEVLGDFEMHMNSDHRVLEAIYQLGKPGA